MCPEAPNEINRLAALRALGTRDSQSEARYQALADALLQIVWVMTARDGEAIYVNRQFATYYGAIGSSAAARLARNHPGDTQRMDRAWQAVKDGRPIEMEARLLRHDGVYRWHKMVIIPVRRDGEIVEWIGTALDIDDIFAAHGKLEETAARLRVNEERLALALDSGSDGLWDWTIETGESWYSDRWQTMLGYEPGELEGHVRTWEHLIHPDDKAHAMRLTAEHFEDRSPAYECEHRLRRKDGGWGWVLARGKVVARGTDGRPLRIVGTHIDITARKQAEQQIAHMAVHDALTGLPNRLLFRDRLNQEIASAKRHGGSFAVLACDLDRFKAVNDMLGHPAGDKLLRTIADRLRSVIRDVDTVARLGGDEFAIILSWLDGPQHASLTAQRIIEAVGRPVDLDADTANIGVSIGIALGTAACSDADSLFKNADIALYRAKAAGRNTFSFYEPGMDAVVASRSLLERDLREAVRTGGFALHYQPILNLAGDATGGFEALMRWHHPQRGMVSPAEFIPLAEETGLIVPLGTWALKAACREATGWPGDLHVAVNVSAVQFQKPGLEDSVVGALAASGLAPHRLELEITESVLIEDSEAAIACLHRLRALGVRISLDDFGTGYSSLSYLRRFPFDKIKIDRSFVRDISDPDTAAIVRAIVSIGERLGTAITAEGVETQEQLDQVRREGCTEVQGFLYGKPLPAADALTFVKDQHGRAAA
ncbi:putative bifunctional diguanylate cyclase/phosphodiesterase [uncultured Methylobacterium sp.]|uniref:putative bifunctional diguanylate cyclase/phosphodiesterase n=1 Tax=uncultured Methylobacterium sp. TaxID=157278 RepID=UPI0035CAB662